MIHTGKQQKPSTHMFERWAHSIEEIVRNVSYVRQQMQWNKEKWKPSFITFIRMFVSFVIDSGATSMASKGEQIFKLLFLSCLNI